MALLFGQLDDKEFLFKLEISCNEVSETIYWIKLIKQTDYIKFEEFESLFNASKRNLQHFRKCPKYNKEKNY